ncbi:S9 family peptidase [Pseudoxanthomonas sp. JBR18]|uniref:alpha/beta hydrolase family protein n=1 Tax=Pseudoxanthomonas sp. JBR18 TaxID=2969308 RepID=UPI0023050540|nr:S9 family peptidase [Pseudoxanthomonas sp. JBR18]WCE02614.1 S9 family peptidase [Pseudoxanthomonas sp. JBR18]
MKYTGMRLVAALLAWLSMWPALALAQVDVDAFLRRDRYEQIKISPTGEFYAVTMPLEDRTGLVIVRRSDRKPTAKVVGGENSRVGGFWWVNDTRVVVAMDRQFGSRAQPYPTGELHAVNADGSGAALIASPFAIDVATGRDPFRSDAKNVVFMFDTMPGDDHKVLVASSPLSQADPVTRVESLNVYNRGRFVIATAPVRNASFTTDVQGQVRFAQGAGGDNVSKLYYRDGHGQDWRLVNDEAQSHVAMQALGFSRDGRTAYLRTEHPQGPDSILAWDVETGARTELMRDAVVDPDSVIWSADGRQPIGARFTRERTVSRYFSDEDPAARLQRSLEKAFPEEAVAVTSSTLDGRLAVVQTWSGTNSGDFYLYDTVSKKAEGIYSLRTWFDPAKMPLSHEVSFSARDGLTLYGYLTLPMAGNGKDLPLIINPHGGPFGIYDGPAFDDDSQLLAQAGYAVLRVNYRGSGHYGRAFEQAGARQWGRSMQDDLTDATRWAIDQGIADPSRICIYGASYGGYAALMGAARDPALYRCAVGYVGVYDLPRMVSDDSDGAASTQTWLKDWVGDKDALDEVSPVNLADRIKVPVFLASGGKDTRAPPVHTERMEKALKRAGVPVETLYYEDEGHGYFADAHRREYYRRLLAFLGTHLGGQTAK